MRRITLFLRTTLGIKALVAATGLFLFGWIVMHMIGNLKVFLGTAETGVHHMDEYAHFLRNMGAPLLPEGFALWGTRILLLGAALVHIGGTITLAIKNRAARPIRYKRGLVHKQSGYAARTMMLTGSLLLIYVVFHILHLTVGSVRWTEFTHGRVYENLYNGFHVWFVSAIYIFAVALLAFHLYHGVWSLFQTLGLDNPDRNLPLRRIAMASATLIFLGFASVPVGFLLDLLPEPPTASVAHSSQGSTSR